MTVTSNATQGTWTPLDTTAIATATLEQKALASEHQIPLTVGDMLTIKEVALKSGWYRGTNLSSGLTGIFPMSYAQVKKSETENFDVVINELTTVIREWGGILKTYYKEKRMQDYRVMKERLFELMQWHTQIFSPKSTPETREPLKKKVIDKIQEGRLLMGLDMVVRTATGDVADETNTGVIPLYRMHQELANSTTTERQMDHAQPQPLTPGAPRKKDDTNLFHLFLDFKIFMCSVGETTELYFSLYNKPEGRFVSDEYQIVLTPQGMPTDIDKMGKLSTIFTDLSKKDLTGLYLVCRLVRKGRMLVAEKETKKEKLGTPVRRPFGCAVLNLEGNVNVHQIGTKHNKLAEHTMPIYATNQESLFPTLHELIIKGQYNNIQEVPRAKGVCIGLALYTGEYQQISKEPALAAVWPTGKLGMPDIILPGFARNDMFVMVEGGEYSKDRKTAQKNVEVIVQLVLENGEVVKDAIFTGSDKSKPEQRSIVYYHSNQPHWNETIRVALPPAVKLSQAYLAFYSRHVSTKEGKEKPPSCVSYLKLTNPDGTIIADKTHNMPSYKPGKSMEEPVPNLKDPAMAKLLRQGEVLRVKTVLCSTMCTQNIALLSLLKWESYAGDLGELMNRFTFVDQGEIIKFIQEIFDSMFAILDSNKIINHEAVYHAIVFTTSLLVDERTSYTNFRPVLDVYILNHLKSIRAHTHLISCLKAIFANMQTQSSKTLMPTLKSLEYIIKFIVVSWLNYLKTNPQDKVKQQANFKNEIMSVLAQINALMQKPEREFIGAQTIALKNFMSIFNDLEKIFVIGERSKIAIDFIDSVKFDESRRLLNLEKLLLILNLVESDLFLRDEVRGIMLPTLVRNLKQHLGGAVAEDVLKCGTILMQVIESLQVRRKDKSSPAALLSSQVGQLAGVLPEAMASIKTLGRTSRARQDLIHCVFSIFFLMDPAHFESFLKDEKGMPRKQYLLSTFDILQSILSSGTAYPENWFTLMFFQYSVIRKVILEMTRAVLQRAKQVGRSAPLKPKLSTNLAKLNVSALELQTWSNTPIGQEYDIWVSYLKLCIEFAKAKSLALENFSENKQRMLKSRNGDIRTDVINALKSMWDALGQHQIHLLDDAVGPFLELVVINQPAIRATGLALYISLLRSEFNDTKALVAMEKATINTLDRLLNDSAAPPSIVDSYRAFYSQTLPEKFTGTDALSVRAQKFLKDTSMFLDLLYELRTLPNTIEYEDDRTVATMKLMAYLKQSDRRDTYVKYVHKLSNQHLSSNLFIEAGLTILLHADLLEWSDDIVDELPDIGYPSETQRERKERLFKLAIEYLDKGKAWEKAIQLLGQLRELYENTLFDYQKLADTLQTESTFYRKIVGVDRFFAEYFRVGYYGKGFESSIQNKEFIYRGFELERISDFIQRVQAKFPEAKQLTSSETPPAEILNGKEQWLQIFAVKPYCEEIEKSKTTLPSAVVKYKQSNDVQVFLYSKPFKKVKTANEFADLWLNNVYYYTEDKFPTTHRRSEIIRKTVIELHPLDNAYNAVKNKNLEIIEITQKYEKGTEQNVNPFTMILKGVIDAAVNGGVKKYQEAFFVPEYVVANPTHAQRVEDLKQSLYDQVNVLETALGVHSKICPPEMIGLLEQLESLFDDLTAALGVKKPRRSRKSGGPGTPTNSAPGTPVLSRAGAGTSSAPGTPVSSRRNHD